MASSKASDPTEIYTTSGEVTGALADFALDATWDSLPEIVRSETRRAVLNYIGCAVGGARSEATETALRGLSEACCGEVPLFGRTETLDLLHAALVNCLSSAAFAYDDTHLSTITHPTGPVASALFALAASGDLKIRGRDLLLSAAIGIEIQCRLSAALLPENVGASRGWWITGVTGVIGTAAACARLKKFDRPKMVAALGLGASQASGMRATHGSMASPLMPSNAARNGLSSALLAGSGYGCNPDIIEGKYGLFAILAPEADPTAASRDLGVHFEMRDLTYKPYPAAIVVHPVIDACLDIARRPGFDVTQIEQVSIEVNPISADLASRRWPTASFSAKGSIFHWAAACFCLGRAGLDEMTDEATALPELRDFQNRIRIEPKSGLRPDQARVVTTDRAGRTEVASVAHATGSAENRMSEEALKEKFLGQTSGILGQNRASALLEMSLSLDGLEDAGEIALVGRPAE